MVKANVERTGADWILKDVFYRVVRSYCYSWWWLGTHHRLTIWWSRLPLVWSKCGTERMGRKVRSKEQVEPWEAWIMRSAQYNVRRQEGTFLGTPLPKYVLSFRWQYRVHFKRHKVGTFMSLCFIHCWLSFTNLIVYEHTLPLEYIMNNEMIPKRTNFYDFIIFSSSKEIQFKLYL